MRAFIETCRLQAELAEELGLPDLDQVTSKRESVDLCGRWSAAPALKLLRSHFISPGVTLKQNPELHHFAAFNLYA